MTHSSPVGSILFVFASILISGGIVLIMVSNVGDLPTKGAVGGVVLIGPIPILFGFGEPPLLWVGFGLALTLIATVLTLLARRRRA